MEDNENKTRQRNRTIGKVVFKDKEEITLNDVQVMVERKELGGKLTMEQAVGLFDRVDRRKSGVIKAEEFIDVLNEHNENDKWLNEYFHTITDEMNSKSYIIIKKLRELKDNQENKLTPKSLDDLDWMINALSGGGDIFEPNYESIAENNKVSKQYLGYLDVFANKRRENDIKATTKMSFKRNQFKLSPEKVKAKRHSLLTEISQEKFMRVDFNRSVSNFSKSDVSEEVSRSSIDPNTLQDTIVLKVTQLLGGVGDFDFNVFLLDEYIQKKLLFYISNAIFNNADLETIYDHTKMKNFLTAISDGYSRDVPYHNDIHAADVLQTSYVMISKGKVKEKLCLQDLDIFSVLIAGLCHDFKHPGFNNIYLVNSKAPLAIRYNDSSPLENFHVAQSFKVLMKPENNFIENITQEEYRLFRRRMIETILATDMAHHGRDLSTLKSKIDIFDIKEGKNTKRMIFEENVAKTYENQQAVLSSIVHCADLSNPAKKEVINTLWVDLVFKEFFNQGDEERKLNLPISLLCDRNTTNIPKSQIGFINFAVKPAYEALMSFIPEIQPYMDVIKENLKRFENIVKEEAKKEEKK